MTSNELTRLTRTLRNLDAMQRRVAKEGYGRNSRSTEQTMDARYAELAQAVRENDAWCDLLDAQPALAATWSRVERAHFGLAA